MSLTYNYDKDKDIYTLKFINDVNDKIFDEYSDMFKILITNNNNIIIIFDLLDIGKVPLKYISRQSKLIKEIENDLDKNLNCSCILTNSDIIRNILKILFKIKKPIRPLIVTNSKIKASEFIKKNIKI